MISCLRCIHENWTKTESYLPGGSNTVDFTGKVIEVHRMTRKHNFGENFGFRFSYSFDKKKPAKMLSHETCCM